MNKGLCISIPVFFKSFPWTVINFDLAITYSQITFTKAIQTIPIRMQNCDYINCNILVERDTTLHPKLLINRTA